jgi:hypothetical protein
MPRLATVSSADLQLISSLVVQTIIAASELALDARPEDASELPRIADEAERKLQIILLGAAVWRSDQSR